MSKKMSPIIRNFILDNPTMGPTQVAKRLKTTVTLVSVIKAKMRKEGVYLPRLASGGVKLGVKRKANKPKDQVVVLPPLTDLLNIPAVPQQVEMFEPAPDPVNHPSHYKVGGIETIDFIEAKKLNYNLGNAVKYITRADHKGNRKQDLEKALWYIKRELGI